MAMAGFLHRLTPSIRCIQSLSKSQRHHFSTTTQRTMPICHLFTNRKDSDLKDGIEGRIARVVADALKKPIERVTVVITPGVRIQRLESTEPACTLNISSFEVFDKERNPSYSPAIFKIIQDELGLSKERCVVIYHDLDKNMIAS